MGRSFMALCQINMVIQFFSNSNIHDYELSDIFINYQEDVIRMEFIDCKNEFCEIYIPHFISFSLSREEVWGKGKYVVSSDVNIHDGIYILEIQLNSGDKCVVKYYNKK